ncbi:MAG TPA: hypothetical protein PL123_10040 [Bacteroidales bacterium]|nr:hypothetical protein [Bacteroidales bacterium]
MFNIRKFDTVKIGALSGFLLPVLIGLLIYLFSSGDLNIVQYYKKLSGSNIVTHIVSLCVFPNVLIFLLFNWQDMIDAAKGVLGMTIVWAILVFAIKFLG